MTATPSHQKDDAIPYYFRRSSYHYDLPEDLIAQQPLEQRDRSRLLVRRHNGVITHHQFADLATLLPQETLLVVNDSRVIAARLLGRLTSGGQVEVLLLEALPVENNGCARWLCIGKPMRKLREGTEIFFDAKLKATVQTLPKVERGNVEPFIISFNCASAALDAWMDENGFIPLPPYIKREDAKRAGVSQDTPRYQTVYANIKGSAAAPTAGLHFTPEVFATLKEKHIDIAPVTLHVGTGTFLPVKTEDIRKHHMHSERYMFSKQTLAKILAAKEAGRPIVAVGTTSLRSLESFYRASEGNENKMHHLCDQFLSTDLFIYPQGEGVYRPWAVSGLITNFHQPESSLLMLVAALIGYDEIRKTYAVAITEKYRFFSYGDASLLWLK